MSIVVNIDDSRLTGFHPEATKEVQRALEEYADILIKECRTEEQKFTHSSKDPVNVTLYTIKDILLRQKKRLKPRRLSERIIRIAAAVLSLIVGWMYDGAQMQNQIYPTTVRPSDGFCYLAFNMY